MKVITSSPLRTGSLYPQEFSWYSFLEAKSTPGHIIPSVASEKIPSDTTGDRSRDNPTSSAEQELNYYTTKIALRLYYRLPMFWKKKIALYSHNHKKHKNSLCERNIFFKALKQVAQNYCVLKD
jgi:hypothetical protein